MNGHLLTLTEAAKAVGRTRQALHGAISKGKLSASKDTFGQWQVDASELFRVYRPASNEDSDLIAASNDNVELEVLKVRLEAQAELIRELRAVVEDVRSERDAWRNEYEDLKQKALPAPEENKKLGFWARLLFR